MKPPDLQELVRPPRRHWRMRRYADLGMSIGVWLVIVAIGLRLQLVSPDVPAHAFAFVLAAGVAVFAGSVLSAGPRRSCARSRRG